MISTSLVVIWWNNGGTWHLGHRVQKTLEYARIIALLHTQKILKFSHQGYFFCKKFKNLLIQSNLMWILLNCDSIFKNLSQNWTLFFEIRCHCEKSWPSALIFFRNLKSLSLVFLSFFGGVEIGMKIHFMVGCFT